MNTVEAADLLRERLDAYGVNFSIHWNYTASGLRATGRISDWEITPSYYRCDVSFERVINGKPARVHVAAERTYVDQVADAIECAVKQNLKPVERAK